MFLSKAETAFAMDVFLHIWINGRKVGPVVRRMNVAGIDLDARCGEGDDHLQRFLQADGWEVRRYSNNNPMDAQGHRVGDYDRMVRELTLIRCADALISTPSLNRLNR